MIDDCWMMDDGNGGDGGDGCGGRRCKLRLKKLADY